MLCRSLLNKDHGAPITLLPTEILGSGYPGSTIRARAEDLESILRSSGDLPNGPTLPVRFGAAVRDEAALITALAPRTDSLLAALRSVGRKREISITLAWRGPPAASGPIGQPDTGPGRRFMLERARHWSAAESRRARATELEAELAGALRAAGVDGAVQSADWSRSVSRNCAVLSSRPRPRTDAACAGPALDGRRAAALAVPARVQL